MYFASIAFGSSEVLFFAYNHKVYDGMRYGGVMRKID